MRKRLWIAAAAALVLAGAAAAHPFWYGNKPDFPTDSEPPTHVGDYFQFGGFWSRTGFTTKTPEMALAATYLDSNGEHKYLCFCPPDGIDNWYDPELDTHGHGSWCVMPMNLKARGVPEGAIIRIEAWFPYFNEETQQWQPVGLCTWFVEYHTDNYPW